MPFGFDPPRLVVELLAVDTKNDNPTLTGDLLEIYFTSIRNDGQDIWLAQRSSRTEAFRPPTLVVAASSSSRETSSAISQDGLSLWFASDRPGGVGLLDVWSTSRSDSVGAWSEPTHLANLSSAYNDLPRPPGQHDLVMPMASDRDASLLYRTMMAARPSTTAAFGAPAAISEFAGLDRNVDGCLTDDGLYLFLSIGTPADLFVTQRRSVTEPFGPPIPLNDLNTASIEADPWLSPDRTEFYFTSESGDGTRQIYTAAVHPRGP